MKEIILWFVAVCVVGILVMVAEKLFGSGGTFSWVIRLMAGILAFVFFIMFIVAILKYANMMPAL
jgi:hypothetical protein